MKRFLILLSLTIMVSCITALAAEKSLPVRLKVEPPAACQKCGMDRTVFGYSRMQIVYHDNGENLGTCSLNCAVTEMKEHPERKVRGLRVADCKTRRLIPAKDALWVIGGEKNGVMTALPKWAFEKKEDAEAFISQYGGRLTDFAEALALAEKEHEQQ